MERPAPTTEIVVGGFGVFFLTASGFWTMFQESKEGSVKRLLLVIVTLTSGLVFALSSPASAANVGSVTVNCNSNAGSVSIPSFSISGDVGDTYTLNNVGNQQCVVDNSDGIISSNDFTPRPNPQTGYYAPTGGSTLTIVSSGSFDLTSNGTTRSVRVTASGSSSSSGVTELLKGTFDANGGTCFLAADVRDTVTNDVPSNGRMSSWAYHSVSPLYMPGVAECARSGYRFAGWKEIAQETTLPSLIDERDGVRRHFIGNNCSNSVQGCRFTAVWEPVDASLTVSVDGRGLVFRDLYFSGGNLACGEGFYLAAYDTWEICTIPSVYARGATLTLYAVPVFGREFLGWGGACADTPVTSPCVVTPVDATEVTASFTPDVTLTAEAEGGWIYDTSTTGVLCGDDPAQILFFGTWVNLSDFGDFPIRCTSDHVRGSTVTLFAWAAPNHRFDAWGGACADVPNDESCSVTLEEAETVTASFSTATLSIEKVGEGTVQEFSLTPRIDCGETCSADMTPDSTVVLVAAPAKGHYFVGWGGACDGTAATSACTLTLAESADVTATFAVGRTVTVAIDPNENNTGLVWSTSPFGVLCGGLWTLCDVTFPPDVTSVTLAAINGRDHQFIGWGGSCEKTSATSLCTVEFSDEVTEHEVAANYEGRSWVRRENPFVGEAILDLSDDGKTVLGGSGTVRIWNDATATWIDRGDVGDWSSYSDWPTLSGDGRAVVICRPFVGSLVMVWDPDSASWISRGDPINPVEIGASCDVDEDGDTLVVCGSEGVRVFRWDAVGSWKQLGADLDAPYPLCRLSSDGNSVLVDPAVGLGAQLVYEWNAEENLWKQRGSRFSGNLGTLSFSGDGNIVVIGGRAYRWDDELSDWSTLGDSFEGPFSSLSSDGSTLVRSDRVSLLNAVERINVHRWDQSTSNWIQTGDLAPTDPLEDLVLHVNGDGTRIVTAFGVYDWMFASR